VCGTAADAVSAAGSHEKGGAAVVDVAAVTFEVREAGVGVAAAVMSGVETYSWLEAR
jgi:hypothetical protein